MKNYGLYEIEQILLKSNKSLKDFPSLPFLDETFMHEIDNRLLREELSYNIQQLAVEDQELFQKLNSEQMNVYNVVVQSVIDKIGGLYFVYGFGGTGKTFLYRTIISRLRSEG